MKTIEQTVGGNITRMRKARGYSQKKLAEEAELNVITLNRIEKGHQRAGKAALASLAKVLHCDPVDFYADPTKHHGPTFDDALALLEAFRKAKPDTRRAIWKLLEEVERLERERAAGNQ